VTLHELLEALAARDSVVYLDGGVLRRRGQRLAPDDPIQVALATFHDEVAWLVASARLCVFCPRLLAEGDRICCPMHRLLVDATATARAAGVNGFDTHDVQPTVVGRRAPEVDHTRPRGRHDGQSAGPATEPVGRLLESRAP
jgi:hypothetical protein